MTNDFYYWFSMVLIIAASAGFGLCVGYIIGLNRGVEMMIDDDELLDAETLEI